MIFKRIFLVLFILSLTFTISCFNKETVEDESNKTFQEWYQEGMALSREGKYEEAIKCFNKTTELNPDYTNGWKDKGLALHELERYEEAMHCYDKVLEKEPGFGVIKEKRKEAEKKVLEQFSEKENEVVETSEEIEADHTGENTALDPDESISDETSDNTGGEEGEENPWIMECKELYSAGKYEEVISLCNKVLEENPGNFDAWLNKLTTLIKLGNNTEADNCIKEMKEKAQADAASWIVGGRILVLLKEDDRGLELYNKALEIEPEDLMALFAKGEILGGQGKYKEAIECFDKILSIEPGFEMAQTKKNEIKKAMEAMETVPDNTLSDKEALAEEWTKKCDTFFKAGNYEEALKCSDKALEIDADNVVAWFNKGMCLNNLKRYDEAVVSFDKGQEAANNYYRYDDELYCRLTCMMLEGKGKALYGLGKTEEATEVLQEMGNYMSLMGGLDTCQSNLKNLATALEMFRSDNGDYPLSLEQLVKTEDGKGYMSKLPVCPNGDIAYIYSKNGSSYSLKCGSIHMKDHKKIVPSYNPLEGIILKEN